MSESAGDERLRLGVGVEETEVVLAPGEARLSDPGWQTPSRSRWRPTVEVAFEVAGRGRWHGGDATEN